MVYCFFKFKFMENDYINFIVEILVIVFVFFLGLFILVNQIFMFDDFCWMSKKNYNENIIVQICFLVVILVVIVVVVYVFNIYEGIYLGVKNSDIVIVLFGFLLFFILGFLFFNMFKFQGY